MSKRYFKDGKLHGIMESYKEDGSFSYSLCHIDGRLKDIKECKDNSE